jgi:hypothetical protein
MTAVIIFLEVSLTDGSGIYVFYTLQTRKGEEVPSHILATATTGADRAIIGCKG